MSATRGPRRLSWGSPSSSSRTSTGIRELPAPPSLLPSTPSSSEIESFVCRDQQEQRLHGDASPRKTGADGELQACRTLLRGVLAVLLQPDADAQLDHYQFTLPAVTAVIRHKLEAAAAAGRAEGAAGAAATAKQQAAAAQREAEQKMAKLLESVRAQATDNAVQQRQEAASLQAQLAALQRQHRQLQNKCAQQARDLRQAADAASIAHLAQQALQEQVQALGQQLHGKAAALSRSASVRQQEAASLRTELQQALAAAEAARSKHHLEVQAAQRAHAAELAAVRAQHSAETQEQLQSAAAVHKRHLQQQLSMLQGAGSDTMQGLHTELTQLRLQQQQDLVACDAAVSGIVQEAHATWASCTKQQQDLRQDVAAAATLAAGGQTALQELQQQVAQLVFQGVAALAVQAELESVRADHQAALKQLQQASLQLATLVPSMQQLQQDKMVLAQHAKALQEQVAAAEAHGAKQQQQQQQQQVEELQQCVDEATRRSQDLQQCLQRSLCDVAALKQEVERLSNVQEQQTAAAPPPGQQDHMHCWQQRQQQHLHVHQLQRVQERLQELCSTLAGAHLAGSEGGSSTKAGKLEQLWNNLFGGTHADHLLQRYEQHKQQLERCQATLSDGSCSDGCGSAAALPAVDAAGVQGSAAADPGCGCSAASMGVQQQLLQLEAVSLHFMLGLQEALAEVLQEQRQRASSPHPCMVGASGQLLSGSPGRLERPGTASSSCSSRHTDASGTSGLNGQLVQAMRRDKQALARELRRLQSSQRSTASPVRSADRSPWHSAVSAMQSGQQQPAAEPAVSCGALTGAECSTSYRSPAGAEQQPEPAGSPPGCGTGQGAQQQQEAGGDITGSGSVGGDWEEVDAVLALLKGSQLGMLPPTPAGKAAHSTHQDGTGGGAPPHAEAQNLASDGAAAVGSPSSKQQLQHDSGAVPPPTRKSASTPIRALSWGTAATGRPTGSGRRQLRTSSSLGAAGQRRHAGQR